MERLYALLEKHYEHRKRPRRIDVTVVNDVNDNYPQEMNSTNNISNFDATTTAALSQRECHELQILRMKLLTLVQEGRLSFSEEIQLMLLRHWNLYDSMFYSSVTATAFSVWSEKGRRQLHHCLAKMGLPLKQCQQTYSMMDMTMKTQVRTKLNTIASMMGISSLTYGSFTRQYNWQTCLSASDVVYAIQALMEAPMELVISNAKDSEKENNTKNSNNKEDQTKALAKDAWLVQFYRAYDALDPNHVSLLLQGIQLAMVFQKTIVNQATQLLEKKALISSRSLKFATLTETVSTTQLSLFTHPMPLFQLASFLMDATASSSSSKQRQLPLVLAALNRSNDHFLVVGLAQGNRRSFSRRLNTTRMITGTTLAHTFGIVFREAAEHTRAQVRHDRFDTAVIEVYRDDMTRFMEFLQLHASKFKKDD